MTGGDVDYMQAALEQARMAVHAGEAPVGAVLVLAGELIAASHNRTLRDHDPSGHAEVVVLRDGGRRTGNHRLAGATLYVTLEPCAMCVGAIVQARIGRVVFGAYDQKAGALGSAIDLSDSAAFNHRFEVQGGLLADDCAAVLQEFFATRR
jgi:tRNA(adenine34) deaminase